MEYKALNEQKRTKGEFGFLMNKEEIKKIIDLYPLELFEFEYNGKDGNIDTYYIPEKNRCEYLLYFDGNEVTVDSLDDVMKTPFVEGKTLSDISEEIIVFNV